MKRKQKRQHRLTCPEDASLILGAGIAVHEIDVATDRRWLAKHPDVEMIYPLSNEKGR